MEKPLVNESKIEGRNAVIEALRSEKPVDKLYILDGCQDGPVMTIKRMAKNKDIFVKYVSKERLDQMSDTGHHQGVIAMAAAYEYAEVEDILQKARDKGEAPFIFLLESTIGAPVILLSLKYLNVSIIVLSSLI